MKKLIVILFFACFALGDWYQSKEISLPKGIQVNDLTISNTGELWLLSASSVLKYETASDNPFLVQEFRNGKLLAVHDNILYVIDQSSHLTLFTLNKEGLTMSQELTTPMPMRISTALVDGTPYLVVQEPTQLAFVFEDNITSVINGNFKKFSTIPSADYSNSNSPVYTLSDNRIKTWTGGTAINGETYKSTVIYSASQTIFDFTIDKTGSIYVLFADSVVVLEAEGSYKAKIDIENIPSGSRIFVHPSNNTVYLYNSILKNLRVLTPSQKTGSREIITLNVNQPNPVDNYTEIEFSVSQPLDLSIIVYNLIGEPVKVITKRHYAKGTHRVVWHADDERGNLVPNGIYFYRLESSKGVAIRQLIVLR